MSLTKNLTLETDTPNPLHKDSSIKLTGRMPRSRRKGTGQWTRVTQACDRCRRLKIRCDLGAPCYQCSRAKHTCHFHTAAVITKPGVRRNQSRTSKVSSATITQPQIGSQAALSKPWPHPEAVQWEVNAIIGTQNPAIKSPDVLVGQSRTVLTTASSISNQPGREDLDLETPVAHADAETPSKLMSMLNEAAEKRWAGESCYISTSSALKASLGDASSPKHSSGLPGADDVSHDDVDGVLDSFSDPRSEGFPAQSDTRVYLESFLNSVHCIFAFVHAKLCRSFFEKLYMEGMSGINASNKAAHLAILSLGWHASWTAGAGPTSTLQEGLDLHTRASESAFECIGKPSIPNIVALVACTLFQQATRQFESAWTTFGVCVRQAQALGLHRDTPGWQMSASLREARRSTWLNIYTLDTFLSICYGRPPAIDDRHCDAYLPVLNLDDFNVIPENDTNSKPYKSPTLDQICAATPSRAQFHLLKAHLSIIARRVLNAFYLCPKTESQAPTDRGKWDVLHSILEDLYELGAAIPVHLQVFNIDQQHDKTFQQQAVCLDILVNHVIILAYKPFMDFDREENKVWEAPMPGKVTVGRQTACKEALYAAASAICSMLTAGRDEILSMTIQLILSAWGVYTTAAELIAHYSISTASGSTEARDAYANLATLLRQVSRLRARWPSAEQEHAILKSLVRKVRSKIQVESRLASPEPAQQEPLLLQSHNKSNVEGTIPPPVEDMAALFENDFDLQLFDDFLESGKMTSTQSKDDEAATDAGNDFGDLLNPFVSWSPSTDVEHML